MMNVVSPEGAIKDGERVIVLSDLSGSDLGDGGMTTGPTRKNATPYSGRDLLLAFDEF
jgi:hypothetical protein